MPDISIPGVSDSNASKMIEALMSKERAKKVAKEKEIAGLKEQKLVWQDFRVQLSKVQESSRSLYGLENPFNDKIALSSNEKALKATATKVAMEEEKEFVIKQMAKADRFMSASLSKDFRVEAGTYRFKVGEETVQFAFKGGSLKEFADTLNQKGKDLIAASLIKDTNETQVLVIEARKTGGKNKLELLDKAQDLGLKAGIIEVARDSRRNIELKESVLAAWEKTLQPSHYALTAGKITLKPTAEFKIPLSPSVALNKDMILEIQVSVHNLYEKEQQQSKPQGPTISSTGSVELDGIRIENEKSQILLPPWKEQVPPEKIEDNQVLFMGSQGRLGKLPPLDTQAGEQKITIPLGELAAGLGMENVDTLYFRNRNTHKEITFSEITIYDPTARGGYKPAHPLSEAQDAILQMDGIDIIRDKNEIDDVIPGVNLTVLRETDEPVELAISRDVEKIKDRVIEFVGLYNQLLTKIDILTRNETAVIEEAVFSSEEEKERAEKNLGLLQGDLTLNQLKNRLRSLMMAPYQTGGGPELNLLAQIGISTDASPPGTHSSVNKTKLRGYLEMDETKFEEALRRHPDWVSELFGLDTDEDFVIDSGVAYAVNTYTRPFVSTGGILLARISTYDGTIARREKDLNDFNRYLEDYERKLKEKYYAMEGTLNTLQESSRALDNLNNQGKK